MSTLDVVTRLPCVRALLAWPNDVVRKGVPFDGHDCQSVLDSAPLGAAVTVLIVVQDAAVSVAFLVLLCIATEDVGSGPIVIGYREI